MGIFLKAAGDPLPPAPFEEERERLGKPLHSEHGICGGVQWSEVPQTPGDYEGWKILQLYAGKQVDLALFDPGFESDKRPGPELTMEALPQFEWVMAHGAVFREMDIIHDGGWREANILPKFRCPHAGVQVQHDLKPDVKTSHIICRAGFTYTYTGAGGRALLYPDCPVFKELMDKAYTEETQVQKALDAAEGRDAAK